MGTVAEYLDRRRASNLDEPIRIAKEMGILAPSVSTMPLDKPECDRLDIAWPGKPLWIKSLGNVIADYGMHDRSVEKIALASAVTPTLVSDRLLGSGIVRQPEIVLQRAGLDNGRKGGYVLLDDNEQPIQIRLGLKGIRKVFGFDPDVDRHFDSLLCFFVTAHEVTDWIQVEHKLHDCVRAPYEKDSDFRIRHSNSKAERLSDEVATELADIIFGWKVKVL